MVKIFVGGFPLDITELELVKLVSVYGVVNTIKIVRDKKTRICKGYAFLEMEDQQSADNVMKALDGTMFGDRELKIKPAAPVTATTPRGGSMQPKRAVGRPNRY